MTRDEVINEYFEWLCGLVCGHRNSTQVMFDKLLTRLHSIEFRYLIPRDQNRAEDGMDLRWRFAWEHGMNMVPTCLDGPCSVLEMMVALSLHCEEDIMDNPNYGNRTGQWFWGMIVNLGLGAMTDKRYDKEEVDDIIHRFLDREYEPNGKGGLFTVRNCDCDMRDIEIQYQLYRYLNSIT